MSRFSLGFSQSAPAFPVVSDVFGTTLYTGNGTSQSVVTGFDMSKEGLVMIKNRSASTGGSNFIFQDTINGTGSVLRANLTNAALSSSDYVTAFNANGFSVGSQDDVNENGDSFVSWTFMKRSNFFDIVSYTGTGTVDTVIPHKLGASPAMIIIKSLASEDWWLDDTISGGSLKLNTNEALNAGVIAYEFTSSSFTLASPFSGNASGQNYVAYLFAGSADPDSAINIGSYTGNGSSTGPISTIGWVPQFLIIKRRTGGTGYWYIFDSARGLGSGNDPYVGFDTFSEASADMVSLTADGFQVVSTSTEVNASGSVYQYLAVRSA